MKFSYEDYQTLLANGQFHPPCSFQRYIPINRTQYRNVEDEHAEKNNSYEKAFRELRRRVGRDYYHKVYPVQSRTLDYSQMAFPAYKFVLPEILADDWLACVGWHKFNRDHALHQPLTAYIVLKLLRDDGSDKVFKIGNDSLLELCIQEIHKGEGAGYLKEYLLKTKILSNQDKEIWLGEKACSKELWKALFVEAAYLAYSVHQK